jgi:hypothetical protein
MAHLQFQMFHPQVSPSLSDIVLLCFVHAWNTRSF